MQCDEAVAARILSLIDFTSLNEEADEAAMAAFCKKAIHLKTAVAAVCILPQWVEYAAERLQNTSIKIATVANFPEGVSSLKKTCESITASLKKGAAEIDVVFPYKNYLAGDKQYAREFIEACKACCGIYTLKVILETGALKMPALIVEASELALLAGADFIKTSTGKIPVGATLEAAEVMLLTIKRFAKQSQRSLGFKASGGVRQPEQALQYIALAEQIMGPEWVNPQHFRLGASQLVDAFLPQ